MEDGITVNQRIHRLEKLIKKMNYWQKRNIEAKKSHTKKRIQKLHKRGIKLSECIKCANANLAL